jgi:protein-S-isoprenylcysteine O-methyltransferase Ste14
MQGIRRAATLAYGVTCYAIFFCTFLYTIGWVTNLVVPRSIDSGEVGPMATALVVDLGLLLLFGLQHSVMARPGFKAAWTRIVPREIERSTYVLASSAVLILLFWQWRPIPLALYDVQDGLGRALLTGGSLLGFGIVLYSTFLIDHFDLFGLRQVFLHWKHRIYTEKQFHTPSLYKRIRHPLYLGWLIAFWVTPTLTLGHLVFAVANTAYILIAIRFEERDLSAALGEPYRRWRAVTPSFVPRLELRGRPQRTRAAEEAR